MSIKDENGQYSDQPKQKYYGHSLHYAGAVYDLTQENMNTMIDDIESLLEKNERQKKLLDVELERTRKEVERLVRGLNK